MSLYIATYYCSDLHLIKLIVPDIAVNICQIARKGRKLQLADINLAVSVRSPRLSLESAKYNSPPIFPAIRYTVFCMWTKPSIHLS